MLQHKKKTTINYGLNPCANLYMTILRIFEMGRGSLTKNGDLIRKPTTQMQRKSSYNIRYIS
jgi:hypothetical protein